MDINGCKDHPGKHQNLPIQKVRANGVIVYCPKCIALRVREVFK